MTRIQTYQNVRRWGRSNVPIERILKVSLFADRRKRKQKSKSPLRHFSRHPMNTTSARYMMWVLSRWPDVIILASYKYALMMIILYLNQWNKSTNPPNSPTNSWVSPIQRLITKRGRQNKRSSERRNKIKQSSSKGNMSLRHQFLHHKVLFENSSLQNLLMSE